MRELAAGTIDVRVLGTERRDGICQMATAVGVFRKEMSAAQRHEEERRTAEQEIRASRDAAEEANRELDGKNTMLEGLSGKPCKYLSPQVYDTMFSGTSDVVLQTERKKLTVFLSDLESPSSPAQSANTSPIRRATESLSSAPRKRIPAWQRPSLGR